MPASRSGETRPWLALTHAEVFTELPRPAKLHSPTRHPSRGVSCVSHCYRLPYSSLPAICRRKLSPAPSAPPVCGNPRKASPPEWAATCGSSDQGRKYADCFVAQMTKAGAPADAVNFTRELYKDSHGDVGILTSFGHVGPVDIAWVLVSVASTQQLRLVSGQWRPQVRQHRGPETT